ncbi:unnamed protein product, partial [marine sediment metagenome]
DLLVFNNTKVIPARLYGQKRTGGKIEILIERIQHGNKALAMIKASKAPKAGTEIVVGHVEDTMGQTSLMVEERQDDLFLLQSPIDFFELLDQYGEVPLPPYLERDPDSDDTDRYQTVYAEQQGAVAAPTAGLHFDNDLITKIEAMGIETAYLTLHVGAGTFQPVRVQNILDHKMHSETIEVPDDVCQKIAATKAKGGRVIAVGTTTVRSLETAAQECAAGEIKPFCGDSD